MKVLIVDTGCNIPGVEVIDLVEGEDKYDYNGHGTIVGTLIKQYSNNDDLELICCKIVARDGSTLNDKIAQALLIALSREVDIVNISLGMPTITPQIKNLINILTDKGTKIVVAAGNIRSTYPALYSKCISVGSKDINGNVSSFSVGTVYDVLELGEDITVQINKRKKPKKYSGSSFAAAIHTGKLAAKSPK